MWIPASDAVSILSSAPGLNACQNANSHVLLAAPSASRNVYLTIQNVWSNSVINIHDFLRYRVDYWTRNKGVLTSFGTQCFSGFFMLLSGYSYGRRPELAQLHVNWLADTNLARIEQAQWIDCLFDGSHQFYGALPEFRVKVFAFPNTDAMLACACVTRKQIASVENRNQRVW